MRKVNPIPSPAVSRKACPTHELKRRRLLRWAALPLPMLLHSALLRAADAPGKSATAPSAPSGTSQDADHVFSYHAHDVLGTSLDLKIVAPTEADAEACHKCIMDEIERLRKVLSTYDPQSEISKFSVMSSRDPVRVSEDLHRVLATYQGWHVKSFGAYSCQMSDILKAWEDAQKTGVEPTDKDLAPLLADLKSNLFAVSNAENEARKSGKLALNVDSIGKGYIVHKAAAVAHLKNQKVTGIMLNIGGDITVYGMSTPPGQTPAKLWPIAVADPLHPADNAAPLVTLQLTNRSVATSGSYERCFTIGGKKFPHILDARTGKPGQTNVVAATVVATNCADANALATILCILPEADGMKLIERTTGAEALLVLADGKQLRSRGFAACENGTQTAQITQKPESGPEEKDHGSPGPSAVGGGNWNKDFGLGIDLTLTAPHGNVADIPYTAVWVEDEKGQCVRVLAAWIGNGRYLRSMPNFWKVAGYLPDLGSVTRATRRSGHYTLVWDGTDDKNTLVNAGKYTICIDVATFHSGRSSHKIEVNCGGEKATAAIPASSLWKEIPVVFGPKN